MNKKSQIQISVVIPAYNEKKFLPLCLRSLQKQKFKQKYEIIVVDNNSTDKTASIAKQYKVRLVREIKKGVVFARQKGTELARGQIIISTDADSTYRQNWLQNIYQEFQNSKTIAVLGPFQYENKPHWGKWYSTLVFKAVSLRYQKTRKIGYAPASNFAFLKSAWEKIGGYNTALTQGGDEYDFYKRLHVLGEIKYLARNNIFTSSRRLKKGIFYSIFITLFSYYILDYVIGSKVTGKTVLGQWPEYRDTKKISRTSWLFDAVYSALLLFLILSLVFGSGKIYSKNRVLTGGQKVYAASKEGLSDVKDREIQGPLGQWTKLLQRLTGKN